MPRLPRLVLAGLLTALALPALAQEAESCAQAVAPGGGTMDTSFVNLRMSLDDADRLLTYKGYKQLVPRGDDLGFVYERRRNKRHELVTVASFTDKRCVDYVAITEEPIEKQTAPKQDTTQNAKRIRGDTRNDPHLRYLSRFQLFGSTLRQSPDTGCFATFRTWLFQRSLTEQINLCALLPVQNR